MRSLFSAKPRRDGRFITVPMEIRYADEPKDWIITATEDTGDPLFTWRNPRLHLEQPPNLNCRWGDAEAVREEFFSVENPEQAAEFLRSCGLFRTDAISVTWKNFQAWQVYFRRQWLNERDLGFPEGVRRDALGPITGNPRLQLVNERISKNKRQAKLVLVCRCAIDAIAAAIFLDAWSKITPTVCKSCERPFTGRRKGSQYCSSKCEHRGWRTRRAENLGGVNAKA